MCYDMNFSPNQSTIWSSFGVLDGPTNNIFSPSWIGNLLRDKDTQAQGPCLSLAHSRATELEVPPKLQCGSPTRPVAGVLSLGMWLTWVTHHRQLGSCLVSPREESRVLIWVLPVTLSQNEGPDSPPLQTSRCLRNTLLSLQVWQTSQALSS